MATLTYLMKTRCQHGPTGLVEEFYSGLSSNYTMRTLMRSCVDEQELLEHIQAAHDETHEHWLMAALDILENLDHPEIRRFDETQWKITVTRGPFEVEVPEYPDHLVSDEPVAQLH